MLREIESLSDIDAINSMFAHEPDRIAALCDVYLRPGRDIEKHESLDPFSLQFRQVVVRRLLEITGQAEYDPAHSEKSSYLETLASGPVIPDAYRSGDSVWLGEMVQSYGGVLKALDVKRGQSVLEYGAGDGQIALHLARLGCAVTVVDIEGLYLARIRAQADALGVGIQTVQGLFGTAGHGTMHDRILFFEAFHHALDHHGLVGALREQLDPAGFVVFAGEPILAHDDHFRPTLPYAWGPRLDGLSLRAMRAYGWCELGFAREYFVELLMRAGFVLSYRHDPRAGRASAYVARLRGDTVDLAGPCLLEAWGAPECWHPGEGNIRWSRTEFAAIPVDCGGEWTHIVLEAANHLPIPQSVQFRFGDQVETADLRPEGTITLRFSRTESDDRIEIRCPVHRPCDLGFGSDDTRAFGVAVSRLHYHINGLVP